VPPPKSIDPGSASKVALVALAVAPFVVLVKKRP
jgi:hypothetical protein